MNTKLTKERLSKLYDSGDYLGTNLSEEEKEQLIYQFEIQLRKTFFFIISKLKFWGSLIYKFTYRPNFNIPTACCHSDLTIEINPILFLSCNQAQRAFILVHEVGHYAFDHFLRSHNYINRTIKATDKDNTTGELNLLDLFYYACDLAINWIIRETFANSNISSNCYPTIKNKPFPLDKKEYYGLSAEEILEKLLEDIQNQNFKFITSDNQSALGSPSKTSNSTTGNNQNKTPQSITGVEISNQPCNTFDDHKSYHSEKQKPNQKEKDTDRSVEFKGLVQQAFKTMQAQGILSGNLKLIYNKFFQPTIDWTEVLNTYLARSLNTVLGRYDYSWNRPNRRLIHQNIYLPGSVGKEINICIGLDVSGSMIDTLDQAIAEVINLVQKYNANTYVISCDSEVKGVQKINSTKELDLKTLLVGGGGTDLNPIFDYLDRELNINWDVVILVTDGFCSPINPYYSKYPLIWLILNNKDFQPDFGDVLHLDKKGRLLETSLHSRVAW